MWSNKFKISINPPIPLLLLNVKIIHSESTFQRGRIWNAWLRLMLTFLITCGPFMRLAPFQRPGPPSILSYPLSLAAFANMWHKYPLGIGKNRTQAIKYWISRCVHTSEITAFFHVIMKKCLKDLLATSVASSSSLSACSLVGCH